MGVISDKELSEVTDILRAQCPNLFKNNAIADDNAMMKLIALGHKMHKPILQYICEISHWVQNNKFFKELNQIKETYNDQIYVDVVKAAMYSFFHRIIPQLRLNMIKKVFVDSLAEISQYIVSIVHFVANLCSGKFKRATCAFQVDAVFAFPASDDNDY